MTYMEIMLLVGLLINFGFTIIILLEHIDNKNSINKIIKILDIDSIDYIDPDSKELSCIKGALDRVAGILHFEFDEDGYFKKRGEFKVDSVLEDIDRIKEVLGIPSKYCVGRDKLQKLEDRIDNLPSVKAERNIKRLEKMKQEIEAMQEEE